MKENTNQNFEDDAEGEGNRDDESEEEKKGSVLPLRCLNWVLASSSMAGMRKASVLPDPVFAAPNTSRPVWKTSHVTNKKQDIN